MCKISCMVHKMDLSWEIPFFVVTPPVEVLAYCIVLIPPKTYYGGSRIVKRGGSHGSHVLTDPRDGDPNNKIIFRARV